MIPKEIKASPIFGEFSSEEQDRYFNLSREKVSAHVDTLYYSVSIFDDSNDPPSGMIELLDLIRAEKAKKSMFPAQNVDVFGLSLEATRFVHYEYCLRAEERFDIFISSILPNAFTPRIVVQLRSRFLVQHGTCQAICRSFKYVEDILHQIGRAHV